MALSTLSTAILLSLAVFLLVVAQQIPANANNFPCEVSYIYNGTSL